MDARVKAARERLTAKYGRTGKFDFLTKEDTVKARIAVAKPRVADFDLARFTRIYRYGGFPDASTQTYSTG